jgi:hypothetical protein
MLVGSREKTSAADNLPAQTIVVFNAAVPDAESLANFTRKNAGDDHLVELDCPTEEESRTNKLGVPTRNAMTSSVASWKNAIPS